MKESVITGHIRSFIVFIMGTVNYINNILITKKIIRHMRHGQGRLTGE